MSQHPTAPSSPAGPPVAKLLRLLPHRALRRSLPLPLPLPLPLLLAATTACVSLPGAGASHDLTRPPWYHGAVFAVAPVHLAALPLGFQPGGDAPMFDPSSADGTPVAALVAEMNDSLAVIAQRAGIRVLRAAAPAEARAPDVRFGCRADPVGDCVRAEGDGQPGGAPMRLSTTDPSAAWTAWAAGVADSAGATHLLLVTLETADYWPRQEGWRGRKVVDLGSANTAPLPWLTALDRPVTVLQLTGAIVSADGRVQRAGAEGLHAVRTPFLLGALGAQSLLGDDDVERLRTARRDELPGRPLVWAEALRALVEQLVPAAAVPSATAGAARR